MATLEEEQQPTLVEASFVNEVEITSEPSSADSSVETVIERELKGSSSSPPSAAINYFGYTPVTRLFQLKTYFDDTPAPDTNGNILVPKKRKSYCEPAIIQKSQWASKTRIPVFKWTTPAPKLYNIPSIAISV